MNNNRPLRSALVSSRLLSTVALVVLFASAALASTPQGSFERTLQVSGPVDLEVLTRSGDITVRSGSSGSVVIRGKIYVSDHWRILPGLETGIERKRSKASNRIRRSGKRAIVFTLII